jgi:hypothetical protein
LDGERLLLGNAYDVNIMGRSVNTIQDIADVLILASKEIGLVGNANKTKYIFINRDQSARICHNINNYNDIGTFEVWEGFQ